MKILGRFTRRQLALVSAAGLLLACGDGGQDDRLASKAPQGTPSRGFPASTDTDRDDDGFQEDIDCDDEDPQIHPGAIDMTGDEIDQNCSGGDRLIVAQTIWLKSNKDLEFRTVSAELDYNDRGQLIEEKWDIGPLQYRAEYVYDDSARLKQRSVHGNNLAPNPQQSGLRIEPVYRHALIEYTYSEEGHLVQENWFEGDEGRLFRSLVYSYDPEGRVLELTANEIDDSLQEMPYVVAKYHYSSDRSYEIHYHTIVDGIFVASEEVSLNEQGLPARISASVGDPLLVNWFFAYHPTFVMEGLHSSAHVYFSRGPAKEHLEWGIAILDSQFGHKNFQYNPYGDIETIEVSYQAQGPTAAEEIWEYHYEYNE